MDAILIAGPTASGKSALATELAARHGGVVVNADSMQVYDTLSVLTARPSQADMKVVPHALYGHVDAATTYSTGVWLRDVEAALSAARAAGRLPVIVGGTGLYFTALLGGLSEMPEIPAGIRAHWRGRLADAGPEHLHAELAARDPETATGLNPADGQRIVRALEVLEATGRPLRVLQRRKGRALLDPAGCRKILLTPERSLLHERIARRASAMLAGGAAFDEVRQLSRLRLDPALPIMKAIGVRELLDVLAGLRSLPEAETAITTATRQYAKRQTTWFRNQFGTDWLQVGNLESAKFHLLD